MCATVKTCITSKTENKCKTVKPIQTDIPVNIHKAYDSLLIQVMVYFTACNTVSANNFTRCLLE